MLTRFCQFCSPRGIGFGGRSNTKSELLGLCAENVSRKWYGRDTNFQPYPTRPIHLAVQFFATTHNQWIAIGLVQRISQVTDPLQAPKKFAIFSPIPWSSLGLSTCAPPNPIAPSAFSPLSPSFPGAFAELLCMPIDSLPSSVCTPCTPSAEREGRWCDCSGLASVE